MSKNKTPKAKLPLSLPATPDNDKSETSSQKEFNRFLLGRENLTAAEKTDIKRTRAESKLVDMLNQKNIS